MIAEFNKNTFIRQGIFLQLSNGIIAHLKTPKEQQCIFLNELKFYLQPLVVQFIQAEESNLFFF